MGADRELTSPTQSFTHTHKHVYTHMCTQHAHTLTCPKRALSPLLDEAYPRLRPTCVVSCGPSTQIKTGHYSVSYQRVRESLS